MRHIVGTIWQHCLSRLVFVNSSTLLSEYTKQTHKYRVSKLQNIHDYHPFQKLAAFLHCDSLLLGQVIIYEFTSRRARNPQLKSMNSM